MIAAALALWLAAAAPDGGAADAGATERDGGADAGAKPSPDEDLIRHLDEIENLELLQNLELFDPAPEQEPPPAKK